MAYHYIHVSSSKHHLDVRYLQLVPVLIWEALSASNLLTLAWDEEEAEEGETETELTPSCPSHAGKGFCLTALATQTLDPLAFLVIRSKNVNVLQQRSVKIRDKLVVCKFIVKYLCTIYIYGSIFIFFCAHFWSCKYQIGVVSGEKAKICWWAGPDLQVSEGFRMYLLI